MVLIHLVVFGSGQPFPAALNLSLLDGTNGFAMMGAAADDRCGSAVASVGDLNGDGVDEVALSCPGAGSDAGVVHVVYGRATAFPAVLNLSALNSSTGITIEGAAPGHQAGSPNPYIYSGW